MQRKGNLRLLICVVEAWSEHGEPTRRARVAQAQALADLCAVDRAWARLSPILEEDAELEAFQVGAELLVDQGRIAEARSLLGRARSAFPDDPILKQLFSRTDGSGTQIDMTEPNEEDVEARIRHAERLLREGSPLKARRMLERIQHDFPEHQRVVDLLWAGEGEFVLKGVSLADLARVHAPALTLAGADEPEHTETGRPDLVAALLDEDSGHGFPSLFKGLPPQTDEDGEREVTIASHHEELPPADEATQTGREDTEIMHVVRKDADPSAADTLIDRAPPSDVDAPAGESEDEHVILRRKATATPTGSGVRQMSDEGPVKLDPSRERVAKGASERDEAADFITKKPEAESPDDTPVSPARSTTPSPRRSRAFHSAPTLIEEEPAFPNGTKRPASTTNVPWTGWLLVLVILGGLVLVLGGLVILLQIAAVL